LAFRVKDLLESKKAQYADVKNEREGKKKTAKEVNALLLNFSKLKK